MPKVFLCSVSVWSLRSAYIYLLRCVFMTTQLIFENGHFPTPEITHKVRSHLTFYGVRITTTPSMLARSGWPLPFRFSRGALKHMFNAGLVAFVIYMDYYIESMDGHKLNLQFGYIEFINRNDFTCCTARSAYSRYGKTLHLIIHFSPGWVDFSAETAPVSVEADVADPPLAGGCAAFCWSAILLASS